MASFRKWLCEPFLKQVKKMEERIFQMLNQNFRIIEMNVQEAVNEVKNIKATAEKSFAEIKGALADAATAQAALQAKVDALIAAGNEVPQELQDAITDAANAVTAVDALIPDTVVVQPILENSGVDADGNPTPGSVGDTTSTATDAAGTDTLTGSETT